VTQPHDPTSHEPTSGDQPLIRRHPSGPIPKPDDTRTGIIRRAPTGPIPAQPDDTSTRRIPRPSNEEAPTGLIRRAPAEDAPTGLIRRAAPVAVPGKTFRPAPSAKTAIATSAVSIVSGWATSVVATDLITGWWGTDRLFCIAVGFLALLFAVCTVAGVILLLLRRSLGRWLVVAGAVVALLTFGSVFIAGARIPWPVYAIPVLPIATAVLALHPATARWCRR
jgi:hypothetical protein